MCLWGWGPFVSPCLAGGRFCTLVRGLCCFVVWNLCGGFVGGRCCFMGRLSSLVFGSLRCFAGSLCCLAAGRKWCPAVGSLGYYSQGPGICNRHTWCSWEVLVVCGHSCRKAVEAAGKPSSTTDMRTGNLDCPRSTPTAEMKQNLCARQTSCSLEKHIWHYHAAKINPISAVLPFLRPHQWCLGLFWSSFAKIARGIKITAPAWRRASPQSATTRNAANAVLDILICVPSRKLHSTPRSYCGEKAIKAQGAATTWIALGRAHSHKDISAQLSGLYQVFQWSILCIWIMVPP